MLKVINNIKELVDSHVSIGIFISGGFDSTVLASVIFKHITDSNNHDYDITLYTVPRTDDSEIHSKRVIEWLTNLYPSVRFDSKLVGNPNLHHSRQVSSGFSEALQVKEIIILADTANPPVDIEGLAPNRIKAVNPKIQQPFLDHDKTMTVAIAIHMGLLPEISTISHSCTQSKLLRCQQCWQCGERFWAFKELGVSDIGLM